MTVALPFDNTFARDMEGFYAPWQAEAAPEPELLLLNEALADELGFDLSALKAADMSAIFAGNEPLDGAIPLSQIYAGHQFGGFSAQLGDGRALLLGEVIDAKGQRRDIQLKGSGKTPFSRGGDGKAALGPVLREYLIGEAMHGLGIPTTRALAAVTTGEPVYRETQLPGAVLTRVASSHLRVGTFQFFAARGETEKVKQLADYCIQRHYPDLAMAENPYLALLDAVRDRQAALIAKWMHVGFIHGVMNTDNMTISGETIDYGPCAFMDAYDAQTVYSSIDTQGRYAFGAQPVMARWNIARLAETLLPLIDENEEAAVEAATASITKFAEIYVENWLSGVRAKLGLQSASNDDLDLANSLYTVMSEQKADHTNLFRSLSAAASGDTAATEAAIQDPAAIAPWLERWRGRMAEDNMAPEKRAAAMDAVNPIYTPRNHLVEAALTAAIEQKELMPFKLLLDIVKAPYQAREGFEAYAQPASDTFGSGYRTFCGT